MLCHEWPLHFPINNCPDPDAVDANGMVFHFVRGDDTDFKSATEKQVRPTAPPCRRAALSCYVKLEDAVQAKANLKALFGEHKIAVANLRSEHGKIKATPSPSPGHHSLWLRMRYLLTCRTLFRVIE